MHLPLKKSSQRPPRRAQLNRRGRVFWCATLAAMAGGKAVLGGYASTTLISFNGTNGLNADGPLFVDSTGNFYGTTAYGGINNLGTVFELSGSTHQSLNTLINFNSSSGSAPLGGLTADAAGNFYGTTNTGAAGYGSVFELSGSNHTALTTLVSFNNADGAYPYKDGLVIDSAGNIYGTTSQGVSSGHGSVFELSGPTHQTLSTLLAFTVSNGSYPNAGLIADASGNLYGAYSGGTQGVYGGVFELSGNTHQVLTNLQTFTLGNGGYPIGGLVFDAAGNLYGTTNNGGAYGNGTVFEIQAGTDLLITLHSFNGSEGTNSEASLAIDPAGNLYGTNDSGNVFEISASTHNLTVLASGLGLIMSPVNLDSAGNIYGTTKNGGTNGDGSVFELTPLANTTPVDSFTGGTSWNTAANWNTSSVPTTSVIANFALNSNYSIGFTAAAAAKDLHIAAGTVGFNLTGQSLALSGGISVADASGENANLTINGGSLTSGASSNSFRFGYSYIGDNQNSTGTMTLNGANWSSSATHLSVGASGTGTLTLANNSNLNLFSGTLAAGDFAGGVGTINILTGSHITTLQPVYVGNAGSGHLLISGGSSLLSSEGDIAADAGALPSDATITGAASNWTTTGSVYVGGYSQIAGSQGTLNVTNGGSLNITGTLKVWNSASTVVNLSSGGTITAGNIDTTSTPAGFNWTGGTLAITSSDVFLQTGGALGPTLSLNNGMTLQATNNTVWINQSIGSGFSTLTVNAGGELDAATIQAAYASGTNGSVNISGGVVNATNAVFSSNGFAVLNLTNGGTLNTTTTQTVNQAAGGGTGGVANLNINGTGSTWNNTGSFFVGGGTSTAGGSAQLTINNGGTLTVGGTLTSYVNGLVNLGSGGTLNIGSLNTGGNAGDFNWTAGTLNVSGGSGISFDTSSNSPLGANFSLNSGMNLISTSEQIGLNGAGSFNQNAGSTNVTPNLLIGGTTAGTYTLFGGNLSAGAVIVNAGGVQQFGGTVTSSSLVAIGVMPNNTGFYNLSGGTVNATTFLLGVNGINNAVGTLTINFPAQLNVSGQLTVMNSASSVTISGGTVTAGSFNVSNAAAFSFTTGQLAVNGGMFFPLLGTVPLYSGGQITNAYAITGGTNAFASPTFTVENGAITSTNASNMAIGAGGGTGTVNVTGAGSIFQGNSSIGSLYVGGGAGNMSGTIYASNGTLNISNGGLSNFPNTYVGVLGGTGVALVSGTGSNLNASSALYVGYNDLVLGANTNIGTGILNLTNGGHVTGLGLTNIGYSGGLGNVNINGSGSVLTAPSLQVGNGNFINGAVVTPSKGFLTITNGGQSISSSVAYIGNLGGNGTVTVSGTGSTFSGAGAYNLNIGFNANSVGLLNVTNGGVVSGYSQVTAGNANGTGTILVSGSGSTFTTSTLYLGGNSSSNLSNGTFTVTNGGQANILTLNVGDLGGQGSATFNASSVSLFGTAFVGSGRDDFATDLGPSVGSFTLINSAQASSDGFLVGSGGGVGTLTVDDSTLNSQPFEFITLGLNQAVEATGIKPSSGTMVVRNAGTVNIASMVVGDAGGTGVATIDGTNSLLNASTALYVGYQNFNGSTPGTGSLYLTNGGQVSAPTAAYIGYFGGNGNANIGSGSILRAGLLDVGESRYQSTTTGFAGEGTLNISSGGLATASQSVSIGDIGGVGTANVNGSGASLSAVGGSLAIGNTGGIFSSAYQTSNGTLHLSSGGQASGAQVHIGYQGGVGIATVDGTGSLLQSTSDVMLIGDGRFNQSGFNVAGNGLLTLNNGAQVSSYSAIGIGCNGGSGVVTIGLTTSSTSILSGQSLALSQNSLGQSGAGGVLNINSAGVVQLSGNLSVYDAATSQINLAGGNLSAGSISISTPSRLNWSSGILNITGSDLVVGTGGGLGANVNISAGQTLLVSGAGHVLNVTGSFNQSGGTTNISGGVSVATGGSFALAGGTFTAATLAAPTAASSLHLKAGTLNLTDPNSTVAISTTGNLGQSLSLGNTNAVSNLDSLTVGGTEYVGTSVNQIAGSNSAKTLVLDSDGSVGNGGLYSLGGGTLSASTEIIGASINGSLLQTGGTNEAGTITIAGNAGAKGSYTSQGTAVVTAGVYVGGNANGPGGSGTLAVQGGSFSITGGLTVYDTQSTFSMTGTGVLTTDSATIYSAGNNVGSQNALTIGTGGLTLAGSDNPGITLSGGSSSSATLFLNGPLTFNGATGTATISSSGGTVPGMIDLGGANRTFNIARGTSNADVTISAGITDGSIVKTGAGILVLQGNNSFSGVGVEISAGTIQMANASALGSGNVAVDSGGTLDLNGLNLGSTLTLTGPGALGVGALINSNTSSSTISGPVTLTAIGGSTLVGGNGNISFGSTTSGGGGLTKIGIDTLTLGGAVSFGGGLNVNQGNVIITTPGSYTGNIVINGGTLSAGLDTYLGALSNSVSLSNGGVLQVTGTFSSSRAISTATAGGAININGSGQVLTLAGSLSGSSPFAKTGAGTLRLTSANAFSGPLTINSGIFSLAGANGSLPNVASIDVVTSGTLELNSALSGNKSPVQDRVNDSAPIILDGGTVSLLGSGGSTTTETLGALIPSSGASTIISTNGSNGQSMSPAALTFTSLGARTVGATVDFEGTGEILFASGVPDGTVLGGWATVNGANFAKYSAATGVIPFGSGDYTINNFSGGVTSNVKLDPTVSTPPVPASVGTVSISTLNIAGNDNPIYGTLVLNQSAGSTLTLNNSGLIKTGLNPVLITGGILTGSGTTQNPGELDISVTGGPLTINSQIAGPFALTERGTGTLVLNGSTANTYTGFTLISGNLNLNSSFGQAIPNGNFLIDGGTVTSLANGQLSPGTNVIIQSGGTWNLNGHTETIQSFNNSGGIMLFNHGTLLTNTSNGTVLLAGGTTTLASVLKSPFITVTGGTNLVDATGIMQASASLIWNGSNPAVTVNANASSPGTVILTDGASMLFTPPTTGVADLLNSGAGLPGTLNLSNSVNHSFTINPNGTVVVSTQIMNGGFSVGGGGTLELMGTNTYSGSTTIGANTTLMAYTQSALGSSGSSINFSGGTLALRSKLAATPYPYSTTVSAPSVSTFIDMDVPIAGPGVTAGTFSMQNMTVGSGGASFNVSGSDGGTLIVNGTFTIESTGTNSLFLHTAANLNLSNGITCTGTPVDITKDLAGTLTIGGSQQDSFASLTVKAGLVQLNNTSGFFPAVPGNLTIANGSTVRAFKNGSAPQIAPTSVVTINSGASNVASLLDLNGDSDQLTNLSFIGGGTLSTGSGTATLGGTVSTVAGVLPSLIFGNVSLTADNSTIFNIASGNVSTGIDMQIAANISGGSFTKAGSGLLYLTGVNTFTGPITVSGGVLRVDSSGNLAGNPVNLAGGTLQFSQAFVASPTGALSLATGLSNVDTGSNTVIETGGINGSGGLVKIGTGTLVLNGTNGFTGGLAIDGGTVQVSSDAALGGSTGPITLAGGTLAINSLLPVTSNRVLNIGTAGGSISDAGGTLTFTAAPNWAGNLTLSSGTINFSINTGSTTVTGSPTLTIASNATVNESGSVDPLGQAGREVNVINSSTLGLFINSGIKTAGTITGTGNLAIASGASLTAVQVQQNNLTLGGSLAIARRTGVRSSTVSIVNSLNLVGTAATLDLSNNDLIVHNGNLATLTGAIQSGYHNGAWNGSGIVSTAAASDTTHLTTLGIIINSNGAGPLFGSGTTLGQFDGQNPGISDVLVKFTYYGDANLDGKIDASDYSRIDNGFVQQLTGWYNGDFNYDGVINGSDYTLIDNAFNTQGAIQSDQIATPSADIATQIGATTSVPEPTTLAMIGVSTIALLSRRGRRIKHT